MKGAIFLFILQGDDGHAKSVFKVISTWETERFRGRLRLEECSESFLPLWQPIHVDDSPHGGHRGNHGGGADARRLEQRPVGGGALRREDGLLRLLLVVVRMLLLSRRGRGCEIPGSRNSMSEKRRERGQRRCVEGLSFLAVRFFHLGLFRLERLETDGPNRGWVRSSGVYVVVTHKINSYFSTVVLIVK